MREIKFRGKNNKGIWCYGNLILRKDGTYLISPDETPLGHYGAVYKESVGQYTGLKDKNGKEIYEGDIIDFSYDAFVGNFDTFVAKGKVIFDEGAFWVECIENERLTKGETYLIYTINLDSIEVIR